MTLDEKITTVNVNVPPAPVVVKGNTTEAVLRALQANAADITEAGYAAVVNELVARYDAKAARRAAKGSGDDYVPEV